MRENGFLCLDEKQIKYLNLISTGGFIRSFICAPSLPNQVCWVGSPVLENESIRSLREYGLFKWEFLPCKKRLVAQLTDQGRELMNSKITKVRRDD